MQEYESFVYLDVQKTGSTFICSLLYEFSREKRLRAEKHAPLGADYDPKKFHFISVRDPADSYLSLYSFGCGSMGKVRAVFKRLGHDRFYDGTEAGFTAWLKFVLKPANAGALRDGFHRTAGGRIAELIGPQSYRYLRLAVPNSRALLEDCASVEDIRALHQTRKAVDFVVRHERFAEDLTALVQGPLRHAIADVDKALEFINAERRINASVRVDAGEAGFAIPDRLRGKIRRREWLLYEAFGY
jgi:hypothetical protein